MGKFRIANNPSISETYWTSAEISSRCRCGTESALTAVALVSSLMAKIVSLYEMASPHTSCLNASAASARAENLDRYLALDGARIRYRDEGRGAAVLMVHGWTLDLDMWDPQVGALQDAFRIVRFDRRGYGLSSGRPDPVMDAQDMRRLCEHLGISRAAVVGMSQGARTALGFAAIAGEMIFCLVLDGPPSIGQETTTADPGIPLEHFRALMRTQGIGAVRREWAANALVSLWTKDSRRRELLAAMIQRYPGNDLLSPHVPRELHISTLPREVVQLPLLVMTGEHEPAQRMIAADELAARWSGAKRAVIREAGHLPNLDNPLEYNAVLGEFLQLHVPACGL
jgi:3-oxoadipate enol-lactonase